MKKLEDEMKNPKKKGLKKGGSKNSTLSKTMVTAPSNAKVLETKPSTTSVTAVAANAPIVNQTAPPRVEEEKN